MTQPAPLALVCSVPLECAALLPLLGERRERTVGRRPAWRGRLEGREVWLLVGGMGKTNAAQALTALLEAHPVAGVVGFGVAGAYPGSGLAPGQVALASSSAYADEGVQAPGGWLSTEGIGIPLLERGGRRWFNDFPAEPDRVSRAAAALRRAGTPARVGRFLTVSCCSGTTARGAELAAAWGALCEGMEGAALAHVAALYETPFLELRAVSNAVEDRDLGRWRLAQAAAAAQEALRAVVAGWDG